MAHVAEPAWGAAVQPVEAVQRSTLYCANVAAGIMVSQFTKWLRRMPVEFDLTLNLFALELTISDTETPQGSQR